jgi:adenylosuccinate lyase
LDVLDTALALQLKAACDLLLTGLRASDEGGGATGLRAQAHAHHRPVARHHAEPITFGLKMAVWNDQVARHRDRITAARNRVAVGKISGAIVLRSKNERHGSAPGGPRAARGLSSSTPSGWRTSRSSTRASSIKR